MKRFIFFSHYIPVSIAQLNLEFMSVLSVASHMYFTFDEPLIFWKEAAQFLARAY